MFTPRLWRGVKQFYQQFMSNHKPTAFGTGEIIRK
jgi:hypothetical protein